MPEKAFRAAVYARQSQGRETSVEDQIRAARGACEQHEWVVTKTYMDLVSASRFGQRERQGWPQLVADVVAGELDVIVLWDASRADRTPEHWLGFLSRCREHGVLIHSIRDRRTFDMAIARDWRTLAEDGVSAGYDSEIKSADVRRGIGGAAVAGKPHGPATYGYRRVYDQGDRRNFTQEPDDNAPIAASIIERIARRDPVVTIIKDLNARKVPAPQAEKWSRAAIRRLVASPTYVAQRHHGGQVYQGNWPALVPYAMWEQANAVLSEPGRKTTAPGRFRWLLSYLVLAPCGNPVNGRPGRPGRAPRYACVLNGCVSVGVAELDTFVTDVLLSYLATPDARYLFDAGDEVVQAARAEVRRLGSRLQEARDSFAQIDGSGISAAALAQLEQTIAPKLTAARAQAARASAPAARLLLDDEQFTVETARPRWESLSTAARRDVLTSVVERIELGPPLRKMSKWSTDIDRAEAAAERTKIFWRQP